MKIIKNIMYRKRKFLEWKRFKDIVELRRNLEVF